MAAIEQFVSYLRSAYAPRLVCVTRGSAPSVDGAAATVVVGRGDPTDLELAPTLFGWSPDGKGVAILDHLVDAVPRPAPASFRVAAIVPVFNESDVIRGTLEYLIGDGIGVYVIDNWSTDATLEIVRQFEGRGLLGFERFPSEPPSLYDLRGILGRVEDVAAQLDADWLVLHDADERRRSPWPVVGLRDALYHVDRSGFNCVDHVTLNFWPIDNGYDATLDLESYFSHFEWSDHPGHFHQRRAWKNPGQRVSLAATAGHDVRFAGRRVYPYKFLLKHYPLRSQAHAERKVLHERGERWNPTERSLGWHQQYDQVRRFVREPSELFLFDRRTFYEQWFIERLSGVGIFGRPPEWATPPMWSALPAA